MTAGSLLDRRPALGASELVARFVPPQRFQHVRFSTYVPDPAHPSQAQARAELEAFAVAVGEPMGEGRERRWRRRKSTAKANDARPGRYLDGGYGVGKTHLLASLWFAAPGPNAYLSFHELTAVIGFLGMEEAVAAFQPYRLLCIDEFELDDVAHTLMAVTFLRSLVPGGTRVAATSNTLPDRLGEGRFAADDFTREIAAIASWFDVLRVDGPDYRAKTRVDAEPFAAGELDAWVDARRREGARITDDDFGAVLEHLRVVHPVQVGAMLDDLDGVVLRDLAPISSQGDALLFVNLVDELYDAQVQVAASGCAVEELFPATYRHGGYRKKYGRCESRLLALLGESRRPGW